MASFRDSLHAAGVMIDEVTGALSLGQHLGGADRERLLNEALALQARWVALMMGLHGRLGSDSLLTRCGGIPAEVWRMMCSGAENGLQFRVLVHNTQGNVDCLRGHSALAEASLQNILRQLFQVNDMGLDSYRLSVSGIPLSYEARVKDIFDPSKKSSEFIFAHEVPPPSILLRVKGFGMHWGVWQGAWQGRVNVNRRVEELVDLYSAQTGVAIEEYRLIAPSGGRLRNHATIGESGLNEGDVIYACLRQGGQQQLALREGFEARFRRL